jgi:hypothetical protein
MREAMLESARNLYEAPGRPPLLRSGGGLGWGRWEARANDAGAPSPRPPPREREEHEGKGSNW